MKKHFIRLSSLVLSLSLFVSLTACGKDGGDTGADGGTDGGNTGGTAAPVIIDCAETGGNIKNVIFIIGDGMGEAQLDAGELMYGAEFAFRDELTKLYSDTNSLNTSTGAATEVTDSAASATAMATGILTYNKYTGVDPSMKELETVLDLAAKHGKSTGFVTTDYLTGATPAGFTAHTNNRNLEHKVITSQIESGVNFLMGQYYDRYCDYEDGIKKNYSYFAEYNEAAILAESGKNALCHCEIETEAEGAIKLSEAAELAIRHLSSDEDGFVLVIEQAHIDKSCHDKNVTGAAAAAKSLNETVEAALAYAKEKGDTAVIISADHETCGLAISADETLYSSKLTSATNEELSYEFTANYHTDTPVPVYVFGFTPRAERCETYKSADKIKNTDIYHFIADIVVNK